jgi:hypothetical protein
MAFTYCTEAEFPAFVKRWLDSDYSRARPRGQGDME